MRALWKHRREDVEDSLQLAFIVKTAGRGYSCGGGYGSSGYSGGGGHYSGGCYGGGGVGGYSSDGYSGDGGYSGGDGGG